MGPLGPMGPMAPMGPMGPWALGPESDFWDLDYYKIQNPDFGIFKNAPFSPLVIPMDPGTIPIRTASKS